MLFLFNKRPTAKELLKHRFIRSARKTSYLTELIEKHKRWKAAGGDGSDSGSDDDMSTEYVVVMLFMKLFPDIAQPSVLMLQ